MSEPQKPIILEEQGAIAIIRLNRPDVLNALDVPMAEAFLAAIQSIVDRPEFRAIVIRGEGRAFCAGGDVASFQRAAGHVAEHVDRIIRPFHEAIEIMAALPQPSIALLHGAVAGAGLSLALACDFAIAAENARFTLAYSRIGASPDGSSSWFLPRIVGLRKAKEIALLADPFDAAEAHRLGLVNRVVPVDAFEREGMALAARLAAGPTAAYGRIKALLHGSFDASLSDQLEAERQDFNDSASSGDFAEGVAAFVEKRAARFEGR
ncbi:enoyl-CoA hydratase/isomerase family protein [Microvirga massiliensis]|uniref:enoyl-CoA hydratase/isomerase family protein n=1 Tax=Microvirga massiliensis TaxID=1033741 RepID=UPI00062B7C92|nr:enoyl-CoA hydratase-related protein [Microvirga massiliensis]